MTLGIDVSALFKDMIMATNTKDLVQKKLVYQYLCHYATANQELSLLAVNTLQKDCRDSSPMVNTLDTKHTV
jgi:AP-4 complex subunit beta-1